MKVLYSPSSGRRDCDIRVISLEEIARSLRHPVYDCVYLALAERERARLLTADRRLIDRAGSRKLGVAITDLRTV